VRSRMSRKATSSLRTSRLRIVGPALRERPASPICPPHGRTALLRPVASSAAAVGR
jgi:hypothetical protein